MGNHWFSLFLILSGENYATATMSLQILSVAFLFAILGGILSSCVNLPLKRKKINLVATLISAAENIFLNLLLIATFKQNGAAFTTFLAEFTVCLILLFSLRDHYEFFDFKSMYLNIAKCVVSSLSIIIMWYLFKRVLLLSGILFLCLMVYVFQQFPILPLIYYSETSGSISYTNLR